MNALIAGERFDFRGRTPAAPLPEVWRELDQAIWRWMLAHGADDVTARVAAWASHAEGQGLFFAHRASYNDHVGLACVGTGKAVLHLRADDLRIELRKCHTIKPPYACAG